LPPTILSFTDQELAALRSAATPLLPGQRGQFLRDVACELGRCQKIEPKDRIRHAVAQVAKAVQRRLMDAVRQPRAAKADQRASAGL
jgi:hypothetical protein